MEASHDERRQFSRVHLLAHARSRRCMVSHGGASRKGDLIDISAGGARIKFDPPPLDEKAKRLVFSVNGLNDAGLLQNLEATVQWRNGAEVGIQFRPEIAVSVRDLQNLVG